MLDILSITFTSSLRELPPTVLEDAVATPPSLTVYLAHALLYNLLVDWLDIVQPANVVQSLVFALVTWATITALAVGYQRRFGRGPAETVYRRLTV